jgi:lysosomal Pro-X carboxypeptidase
MERWCASEFSVSPRPSSARARYWGTGWSATTAPKVVFTNGRLDPWGYGGVGYQPELVGSSNHVGGGNGGDNARGSEIIWIDGAAHHLDLRFPNAQDPPSVVVARAKALALIKQWLGFSGDEFDSRT